MRRYPIHLPFQLSAQDIAWVNQGYSHGLTGKDADPARIDAPAYMLGYQYGRETREQEQTK